MSTSDWLSIIVAVGIIIAAAALIYGTHIASMGSRDNAHSQIEEDKSSINNNTNSKTR